MTLFLSSPYKYLETEQVLAKNNYKNMKKSCRNMNIGFIYWIESLFRYKDELRKVMD